LGVTDGAQSGLGIMRAMGIDAAQLILRLYKLKDGIAVDIFPS